MKISTHDGLFHADEVLSVAILSLICNRQNEIVEVFRTRNPEIHEKSCVVVDVGGVYAPPKYFDHHQQNYACKRPNGVPYAAAGLVWRHFGPKLVQLTNKELDQTQVQGIVDRIDRQIVLPVDAHDVNIKPRTISPTGEEFEAFSFSNVISGYNCRWDEDSRSQDRRFHQAVSFAKDTLERAIERSLAWRKAREIVAGALHDVMHRILVLPQFAPWQEHLAELEEIRQDKAPPLFVIYPDQSNKFMAAAVPTSPGSRDLRCAYPNEWGGLQREALQEKSGVSDAVFCHGGRHLAGAVTIEGAISLAKKAMELAR